MDQIRQNEEAVYRAYVNTVLNPIVMFTRFYEQTEMKITYFHPKYYYWIYNYKFCFKLFKFQKIFHKNDTYFPAAGITDTSTYKTNKNLSMK